MSAFFSDVLSHNSSVDGLDILLGKIFSSKRITLFHQFHSIGNGMFRRFGFLQFSAKFRHFPSQRLRLGIDSRPGIKTDHATLQIVMRTLRRIYRIRPTIVYV